MPLVSSLPPRFSKVEVKKIVKEFYELDVKVSHLVSDIGQNFHIADQSGNEFVFKIANPEEKPSGRARSSRYWTSIIFCFG